MSDEWLHKVLSKATIPHEQESLQRTIGERRKDQNGFGSFQLAERGCSMLKQAGGRPGVSYTPGNHNVSRLPEISAYSARELKPEVE